MTAAPEEHRERLTAALADLAVHEGVQLRPGQDLLVVAYVEQLPLARAVSEAAYAAGAHYVDVWYWDQHAKRARIRHAPRESLTWVPPWLEARATYLSEQQGALIQVNGNPEPHLLRELDVKRVAADRMPTVDQLQRAKSENLINWTIIAYPTAGWADAVFGKPDLDRLWAAFARAMRLEGDDPNLAWRRRLRTLADRAAHLTERRFIGLELSGDGTDLYVGLHPDGVWMTAEQETRWGHPYVANMPTEEIFTTPDWRHTHGTVRATKPLARGGILIEELELHFAAGEVIDVRARQGAELIESELAQDEGARSLGEIALVDRSSPIERTGITFLETLFDENASSHLAYGSGTLAAVPGAAELAHAERRNAGINVSSVHTDIVIGGPSLQIEGISQTGERIPILHGGEWRLPNPPPSRSDQPALE